MKIFTIKDIPIKIHYSLYIFISIIVAYNFIFNGLSYAATLFGLFFILFSCVLMHELGHAMVAKKFLMKTRDITLYPFGGIATINMKNMDSRSEMWVAMGGPLTNVLLAILSVPLIYLKIPFTIEFFVINLIMFIFNMLPAFPMDGGRVLRALLSRKMDRDRATIICIRISGVFSIIFLIMALLFGFISLLIVAMALLYMVSVESKRLSLA